MRKDHRPYGMKKAYLKFQNLYADHFLRPHFERFGKGHAFMKPWNIEVFGGPVELGDFATVIATRDQIIRLSVWSVQEGMGRIARKPERSRSRPRARQAGTRNVG